MPAVEATDLALVTSLRNAGVSMKAELFSTGYGQTTLEQAAQEAQGVDFITWRTPVDRPNAGLNQELQQLKQYASITGVPEVQVTAAWVTADLTVAGLEAAGPNPTRASFESTLRGMTAYTANGVLVGPDNLSVAAIGQSDPYGACWYVEKLTGLAFHAVSQKPLCGTKLPETQNG
jgi:hypothetical protein